jgi:hypothetical protein
VIAWLLACKPEPELPTPTEPAPTSPTDTSTPTDSTPSTTCGCDDGLSCTLDTCEGELCVHELLGDCVWPATSVVSLTGTVPSGGLQEALSTVSYDPVQRVLWTSSSAQNEAQVWRIAQGEGSWALTGEWTDLPIDIEGLAVVDPVGSPHRVYAMAEDFEAVVVLDLSQEVPAEVGRWELGSYVPTLDNLGPEALTFVPDAALLQGGFVDMNGQPYPGGSALGGLMLVGHQNGGRIYAFDLGEGGEVVPVGAYLTSRPETSGLEFDALTNSLYIWHGGANDLEVTHLSSTDTGEPFRKLDTQFVFDHPSGANIEGVAISPAPCVDGVRSLFLAAEDAGPASLEEYLDWPLCEAFSAP